MRQLIVENKIGGHFNCGKIINNPKKNIVLEYYDNDICVLSKKSDGVLTFVFNLPYTFIKNKRKQGVDGYNNLIYIFMTKTLKRECGNISKNNIKFVGVSKKRKVVGGEEMFYTLFKVKITKSIEVQLLKKMFKDIKRVKKDIAKILQSEDLNTYRYI